MKQTAADKTRELLARLYRAGVVTDTFLSLEDAETLRKAELTLNRWSEKECGWSTPGPYGASFALVRDECDHARGYIGTEKPYIEIHPNVGTKTRVYFFVSGTIWQPIPDLEAGALRRVEEVCERNGLQYYHQRDPRGCSLYVSRAFSEEYKGFHNPYYQETHPSKLSNWVPCSVR